MNVQKGNLKKLREALAATKAAKPTPERLRDSAERMAQKPTPERLRDSAERMAQKPTPERLRDSAERMADKGAEQATQIKMHDPEVAPHLFKKWIGDRVAVVRVRNCDNPNCAQRGEFRAPKSRYNLEDYYWFCLDHVRIYNAAWDYYQGMSVAEIEEALRAGTTWERPTWPMGDRKIERRVRDAFKRVFDEDDIESNAEHIHAKAQERGVDPRYAAQLNALRELGLAPPIDFEGIKKRYRDMVKMHHPDVQSGPDLQTSRAEAEEKIKRLNVAFTVLKEFYAFETVNMENAQD